MRHLSAGNVAGLVNAGIKARMPNHGLQAAAVTLRSTAAPERAPGELEIRKQNLKEGEERNPTRILHGA